ncbi:hypothetical protein [Mucilaginibacter arboris]|uniref:Uncharacterized protein n=1 Tax=Mucilaginibacter arboris TaxID=2682090 RepID=A0A7K1T0U8_9SPHI|nr:hypothetical protein [Mucilaginibacter arboris]MVN23196.1 hypothetical protein [Mucilaginibacter arboris]
MRIICPEHGGIIRVAGKHLANIEKLRITNMVVECPVCEDEVIINGVFNFDHEGKPHMLKTKVTSFLNKHPVA